MTDILDPDRTILEEWFELQKNIHYALIIDETKPRPCPACDDTGEIYDNGERVSVCVRCGGEA